MVPHARAALSGLVSVAALALVCLAGRSEAMGMMRHDDPDGSIAGRRLRARPSLVVAAVGRLGPGLGAPARRARVAAEPGREVDRDRGQDDQRSPPPR